MPKKCFIVGRKQSYSSNHRNVDVDAVQNVTLSGDNTSIQTATGNVESEQQIKKHHFQVRMH